MRFRRREAADESRLPWWFVPDYYRAQHDDVPDDDAGALEHFERIGRGLGLAPNPLHDLRAEAFPADEDAVELLPVREVLDVVAWLAVHPSTQHRSLVREVLDAAAEEPRLRVFRAATGARRTWSELLRETGRRGTDRRTIQAADVFDADLYTALAAEPFRSPEAALWHYLEVGAAQGLPPHARFHPTLAGGTPSPWAWADALRSGAAAADPLLQAAPGPEDDTTGTLGRRVAEAAPPEPRRRCSVAELLAADVGTDEGAGGPVLVLVAAADLTSASLRAARSIVAQTHQHWTLVVLAPLDPRPWLQGLLDALTALDPRITVHHDTDPAAWPTELLAAHPDHGVAVWDGRSRWERPALTSLAGAVPHAGAARGWVSPDDTAFTGLTLQQPARRLDDVLREPPVPAGVLLGAGLARALPHGRRLDVTAWDGLLRAADDGTLQVVGTVVARGALPGTAPVDEVDAVRAGHLPALGTGAGRDRPSLLVTRVADPTATHALVVDVATRCDLADVVVVAPDLPVPDRALLAALLAGLDVHVVLVTHERTAGAGLALARGLARCAGTVVALAPDDLPGGSTWPAAALEAVADGAAAAVPVAVSRRGVVRSAGLAGVEGRTGAHHLLAGHPVDDAALVAGLLVDGAATTGVVVRRSEVRPSLAADRPAAIAAVSGLEVRAVAETVVDDAADLDVPLVPGPSHDPLSRVCGRAGWQVLGTATEGASGWRPVLRRTAQVVQDGPAAGRPRLRWALKNPAPASARGDLWGDTFFLDSLAEALRRLGQEVVVDREEAHRRPSDALDDVTLSLRGRRRFTPPPGGTSVLWVISHPDDVTDDELGADVDLVYAASRPWAAAATARTGREVRPLLQATDVGRFHPDVEPVDGLRDHALFVGNHRQGGRTVVTDLLATDVPVAVHGGRWDGHLPDGVLRSTFVANHEVARYYRGAGFVVNDHWPDMARAGFVSNRAFDAAATGALVVSDAVDGGFDDLHGLVRAYASVADLRALVGAGAWLGPAERRAAAERVVAEHGFDARAATLLDDVLARRSAGS